MRWHIPRYLADHGKPSIYAEGGCSFLGKDNPQLPFLLPDDGRYPTLIIKDEQGCLLELSNASVRRDGETCILRWEGVGILGRTEAAVRELLK